MTNPSISQIRLGFQILGQQHHLPTRQIQAHVAAQSQLSVPEREAAVTALTGLAALVDGENLGREDFHRVLNQQSEFRLHHDAQYNPELEAVLREGLGLPAQDPQDIQLNFRASERDGNHYSWITIMPREIDPAKPVLIFVTGLHHPSAVYLQHLVELARREHRVIHSVDLPSMGGSILADNASVYASHLNEAVLSCIQEELLLGQRFDLMGHSLGTVPVREIESEALENSQRSYHGRLLNRVVLVAPVPSQEDRELGYQLRPSYAWSVIGALLSSGAVDPERVNELFVQNHNASDQAWLARIVGPESFSSSLWGTLSVFLNNYRHPFANRLGVDSHLRVILPAEDRLIRVQNPEAWQNRRGIYWVEHADHSFMGGSIANASYVDVLQRALNEDLNPNQEVFSRSQAYRRLRSSSFAAVSASSRGALGGQLYLGGRQGLAVAGPFGLDVELGLQNFVGGYPANDSPQATELENRRHFAWRPQLNAALGLNLLRTLPLRLLAGGYVESDAITSIRQNDFYGQAGALGGLEINFENTLLFRTLYQQPLWDAQGRSLPRLGEFWFNLGAHF